MTQPLPITEIFLKGTFEEMGEQYMAELGPFVIEQLKLVGEELGEGFFEKLKPLMSVFFKKHPPEFQDMYKAMAHSKYAQEHIISLEELVFLDVLIAATLQHPGIITPELIEDIFTKQIDGYPEIEPFLKQNRDAFRAKMAKSAAALPGVDHCSTIAISQESKMAGKDELAVGRSFDWPKKAMRAITTLPIVLHLECTDPKYPNPLTTISHPGSISGFTFSTPDVMWELNSAAHAMLTAGEMRMDRPFSVSTAMLHLMASQNYEDALTRISNMVTDYPSIVTLAGKTIQEAAIIEMYPGDIRNKEIDTSYNIVHRLNDDNVDPFYAISEMGFARSNLIHGNGWDEKLGHHHVEDTALTGADIRENNLIALVKNALLRLSSATKTVKAHLGRGLHDPENPGATKFCEYDDLSATYYQTVNTLGKHLKKDGTMATDFQVRVQQAEKDDTKGFYTQWEKFCTKSANLQPERVEQSRGRLIENIARLRMGG